MSIIRDRSESTLKICQERYVLKFSVQNVKIRSTSLVTHFNLTKKQSPKIDEGKKNMAKVSYAFLICSLMYVMVCTRPYIAHDVGIVSSFCLIQEESIGKQSSGCYAT